jgi:hypothetical protein
MPEMEAGSGAMTFVVQARIHGRFVAGVIGEVANESRAGAHRDC